MTSRYEIVSNTPGLLTIHDVGGPGNMSVTNDAERVVDFLRRQGLLTRGKKLNYYDSEGRLDQITWEEDGSIGFATAYVSDPAMERLAEYDAEHGGGR